jgi:hypothetical protein
MKQDVKLSKKYAKEIPTKVGGCFLNAQMFVLMAGHRDALYVEGFASKVGGEHGWVKLDGKIVDITPGWTGDREVEYFPGYKYTRQEVLNITKRRRVVNKPLWYRGGGEAARVAWMKAHADCMSYLGFNLSEIS